MGSRSADRPLDPARAHATPAARLGAYGSPPSLPAAQAPGTDPTRLATLGIQRGCAPRAAGVASPGNPIDRRWLRRARRDANPDDGFASTVVVNHDVIRPDSRDQHVASRYPTPRGLPRAPSDLRRCPPAGLSPSNTLLAIDCMKRRLPHFSLQCLPIRWRRPGS